MSLSIIVLALVTLQRLAELFIATANTRALMSHGAYERGSRHYTALVAMHGAWLVGLWVFGWSRPVDLGWLAVFLVLQALRLWVLATLGGRWTTRIIISPGAPLVRNGPYRYFSHPNYMVVVAEIAVLPLAFGLVAFATVFTLLNAIVLLVRLRAESQALREGVIGA